MGCVGGFRGVTSKYEESRVLGAPLEGSIGSR